MRGKKGARQKTRRPPVRFAVKKKKKYFRLGVSFETQGYRLAPQDEYFLLLLPIRYQLLATHFRLQSHTHEFLFVDGDDAVHFCREGSVMGGDQSSKPLLAHHLQ